MTHRSPGFTEEDARNGIRSKTKPAAAIRHQQRRERESRRHFESTVTINSPEELSLLRVYRASLEA
jgi:hypothetical protein